MSITPDTATFVKGVAVPVTVSVSFKLS